MKEKLEDKKGERERRISIKHKNIPNSRWEREKKKFGIKVST